MLSFLAFLDLQVPEASALDLFLFSDDLFGFVESIVGLELPVEIPLVHGIFVVDFFDLLVVALDRHPLHGRIVHVTLHIVHRVFEVGVGGGRIPIKRSVDAAISGFAGS